MNPLDRYNSLFQYYGSEFGINWLLLKAQACVEAGLWKKIDGELVCLDLNPNAESLAHAKGLTQFMDATAREWRAKLKIKNFNPFNPEHSIQMQAAYMQWLIKFFDGDLDNAISAYNGGPGTVQKWLHGHLELPEETKNYLPKVKRQLREITNAC